MTIRTQTHWQINYLALMVALPLFTIFSTGCNLSSSQRYQFADSSYRATVSAVTVLALAGEVSEEELQKFDVVRGEARSLLDSWSQALMRGEDFASEIEFQTLLDAMLRVYLRLENPDVGSPSSDSTPPYNSQRTYRARARGSGGQPRTYARGT